MKTVDSMVSRKVAFQLFNLNLPEVARYTDTDDCECILFLNTKGVGIGRIRKPRKYLLIRETRSDSFFRVKQTDSEKVKKFVLAEEDKQLIPMF